MGFFAAAEIVCDILCSSVQKSLQKNGSFSLQGGWIIIIYIFYLGLNSFNLYLLFECRAVSWRPFGREILLFDTKGWILRSILSYKECIIR